MQQIDQAIERWVNERLKVVQGQVQMNQIKESSYNKKYKRVAMASTILGTEMEQEFKMMARDMLLDESENGTEKN